MNRREVLLGMGACVATTLPISLPRHVAARTAESSTQIRAVAFDAFPIFDPRPILALCRSTFPEHGETLARQWFSRIFSYTWLRTSANRYAPFPEVIREALSFELTALKLEPTAAQMKRFHDCWYELSPWPDVISSLQSLGERGIRMAFLSNMTESMLRTNAAHAEIEAFFEGYLSTDLVQLYKPHPKAYAIGEEFFGLRAEEIVFSAFASWDAVGAAWYGYPTVWINRLGAQPETIPAQLHAIGSDLSTLTDIVDAAWAKKSGESTVAPSPVP